MTSGRAPARVSRSCERRRVVCCIVCECVWSKFHTPGVRARVIRRCERCRAVLSGECWDPKLREAASGGPCEQRAVHAGPGSKSKAESDDKIAQRCDFAKVARTRTALVGDEPPRRC